MPATTQVRLPERYRVTRHIAAGGMASVYAAEDRLLGRLVAVKVLASHVAADDEARTRFRREARAAARVSGHPNVVTIFDVGDFAGQPFIVMEHFAGGTLATRLRSGRRVPVAHALTWLGEAAAALDHAHRHGIVHRDVKPGNLLLDRSGRLAVGDFGIARMGGDGGVTATGQVLGTAGYLSPEQALGEPATEASDRYALGVVAFELLTGSRLFAERGAAAQARAHVETRPPAASSVAAHLPEAADPVLARALEKDPRRRWPSAQAFVEALEAALPAAAPAEESRWTRPPAAAPRPAPAPPARRRPVLAPWIALALVALLIGAGIAFLPRGDDAPGPGKQRASRAASGGGGGAKKARTHGRGHAKAARTASGDAATQGGGSTAEAADLAGSSSELEARGHALLLQGSYTDAVPVLEQATQGCPVSTTDPCAYALYDLGRALRLAGRPDAAIPILRERLRNPDQQATVEQELALAQQAAATDD